MKVEEEMTRSHIPSLPVVSSLSSGRLTQVLSVGALVALHVQQGVAVVDEAGSVGAERDVLALAVAGNEEAVGSGRRARAPGLSLRTVGTGGAGVPTLTWGSQRHG